MFVLLPSLTPKYLVGFNQSSTKPSLPITTFDIQARREGGCDGCARTPPQTAEVHFFVKKINTKKNNSVVLFVLF